MRLRNAAGFTVTIKLTMDGVLIKSNFWLKTSLSQDATENQTHSELPAKGIIDANPTQMA